MPLNSHIPIIGNSRSPGGSGGTPPPLLNSDGLQYLTANNGDRLFDKLPHVCPKPVVCDVPCVIFDDAGDKAEFTIPSSLDDVNDVKFSVTLRLRAVDAGVWDIIFINMQAPAGAWLHSGGGPTGATNGVNFGYYDQDGGDSIDWYIYAPDSLLGQMVTFTFERKNNVVTYLLNGEPAEHTEEYGDPTLPFKVGVDFTIGGGELNTALKRMYFNLGGYEAEFNFEEGAGNILFNSKDSSANAYITSTSGLPVMRAGVMDGIDSKNAKNGCCKVSGTFIDHVPDDEFVYIPADERGIALDPTMVPSIHITDDLDDLDDEFVLGGIWESHANFWEMGSGMHSVEFLGHENMWVFNDENIGYFYFPTGVVVDNEYPPKGTFLLEKGGRPSRTITIDYDHPNIDDDGKIIKTNLNCVPGIVHNGSNFKLKQDDSASPKPLWSIWYTDGGSERRLHLTDFLSHKNGEHETACKFQKVGASHACQLLELTVYNEGAVENMTPAQKVQLNRFFGNRDCSAPIPPTGNTFITNDGNTFTTADGNTFITGG